jgi:hypothetical protein
LRAADIAAFILVTWKAASRTKASSAIAALMRYAYGVDNILRDVEIQIVRKAASKHHIKRPIPQIDLAPLFDIVTARVKAADDNISNLDDLAVRNMAMATLQIDGGLRPSDVAALPAMQFRTEPAGLSWERWHEASSIFAVFHQPKEMKLRQATTWWSDEVELMYNPSNTTADYRRTLSVTYLQEMMRRFAARGWLDQPREVHGRQVLREFMFVKMVGTGARRTFDPTRTPGPEPRPALSSDAVGNQGVGALMKAASFTHCTKGQSRHAVATYVYHFWVRDAQVEISAAWLQRLLRHTDGSTMLSSYIADDVLPAVRARIGRRAAEPGLRLTELLRL